MDKRDREMDSEQDSSSEHRMRRKDFLKGFASQLSGAFRDDEESSVPIGMQPVPLPHSQGVL